MVVRPASISLTATGGAITFWTNRVKDNATSTVFSDGLASGGLDLRAQISGGVTQRAFGRFAHPTSFGESTDVDLGITLLAKLLTSGFNSQTARAYLMTTSWDHTTLTWANQPAASGPYLETVTTGATSAPMIARLPNGGTYYGVMVMIQTAPGDAFASLKEPSGSAASSPDVCVT